MGSTSSYYKNLGNPILGTFISFEVQPYWLFVVELLFLQLLQRLYSLIESSCKKKKKHIYIALELSILGTKRTGISQNKEIFRFYDSHRTYFRNFVTKIQCAWFHSFADFSWSLWLCNLSANEMYESIESNGVAMLQCIRLSTLQLRVTKCCICTCRSFCSTCKYGQSK